MGDPGTMEGENEKDLNFLFPQSLLIENGDSADVIRCGQAHVSHALVAESRAS